MTIKQSTLKKVPHEFIEVVESMTDDEIKSKVFETERHIYEITRDKEGNEKLVKTREDLKEMTAPYRDAKSVEQAKMQFLLNLLEERGKI